MGVGYGSLGEEFEKHYQMQAFVSLNICVSAAFCAAQTTELALFKIPYRLRFHSSIQAG